MTPIEFLTQYHQLVINDTMPGISCELNITRYAAGFPEDNRQPFNVFYSKLATRLKKKFINQIPESFNITDDPRVDPTEPFYREAFRRSFECRASPDEMRDTLRMAVIIGMKKASEVKSFGEKHFGQDCNSFAGNYLGISPSTGIHGYVLGYTGINSEKAMAKIGGTRDVWVTSGYLPFDACRTVNDIKCGDVAVTIGEADKRGSRFRHIAVVESFTPSVIPSPGPGKARFKAIVTLAEWGTSGDIKNHIARDKTVTVTTGLKCSDLKIQETGRTYIGFDGHTPDGKPAMRVFLDTSKVNDIATRGFHVGTVYGP